MCFLFTFALGSSACSGDGTTDASDTHTASATAADTHTPADDVNQGVIAEDTADLEVAAVAPLDAGWEAPDTSGPMPGMDAQEPLPEEIPWLDDPVWQCDNGVPVSAVIDLVLSANSAGCPWSEGDNLAFLQGAFAAHETTIATAELPGPAAAICSVDLESAAFDPDYEQSFVYDDHFVLAFDDVVLLSSYGDLVDALPQDRNLYLFDWEAIAGAAMNFNNNGAYCLGYGGDDPVDCAVPAPESGGPVAYSIGGGLGAALSGRAVQEQRIEFMLVTFGDNDPDADCRNSELRMQVVIDYVIAP